MFVIQFSTLLVPVSFIIFISLFMYPSTGNSLWVSFGNLEIISFFFLFRRFRLSSSIAKIHRKFTVNVKKITDTINRLTVFCTYVAWCTIKLSRKRTELIALNHQLFNSSVLKKSYAGIR